MTTDRYPVYAERCKYCWEKLEVPAWKSCDRKECRNNRARLTRLRLERKRKREIAKVINKF